MRITAGKYKNKIVKCPKGVIRPAMEKMRISLFSILKNDLSGLEFLDLFSGSGCMAIEAASRGAKKIVAVEKDFGKKKTILDNLSYVEEEKKLYICDVYNYIKRFRNKESFDIIYLDPPFDMQEKVKLINIIANTLLLKDDGIIIIHYPEEDEKEFENIDLKLMKVDERKYGRSHLKFFKQREASENG